MTIAAKTMSVAEYFEFEQTSEVRHEYVNGQILAMAGETREHYRIARNLTRVLEDANADSRCEVVMEAIRVRVQQDRYRYPDVVVSCDPGEDRFFLENPCFIAEVLSESTANTDHNQKLEEYTRIPSLQRYAIVSSDLRRVILYKRTTDGWGVEILESGAIEVPCLQATVTLERIYEGLPF
jgi:Uma2 family endonuclease